MNEALTVSALNALIRESLELTFHDVWLEGEVSNLSFPSSGHVYFSLKDESAMMACVLFKGQQRGLHLPVSQLAHGMTVRVHGRVTVYAVRGHYQLSIDQITSVGEGALELEYQKRFERLKSLGYFEPEHKAPLPAYPKRIGIITSLSAAALQDVLAVFARRNPLVELVIYPSLVQGNEAAAQLQQQVQLANARREVEVLLLIRGGGSLEDLWAFNDEMLAMAVARSKIPVISGVGHESDTTLVDFCATLRAATPTAAAELSCPSWDSVQQTINAYQSALHRAMHNQLRLHQEALPALKDCADAWQRYVEQQQKHLEHQSALLTRQHPVRLHQQASQRLDELEARLLAQGSPLPKRAAQPLHQLQQQLTQQMPRYCREKQQNLGYLAQNLANLSPLAVLGRGFAVVRDEQGHVLRGENVQAQQKIQVQLKSWQLNCVVESLTPLA